MAVTGIFDIIGPNMVGPSSFHSAGALRIALLAGKMLHSRPASVQFTLYGSFARTYRGHGTDRALLAGILGMNTEDLRIRDSFSLADQAGLQYSFEENTENREVHPNTVDISLRGEDGEEVRITGVSVGGGAVRITRINGVKVRFSGEYNTLIVRQLDTPGVVAAITRVLAEHHINIAFMRMYREGKGDIAYTIVEADGQIPEAAAQEIRSQDNIHNVTLITI